MEKWKKMNNWQDMTDRLGELDAANLLRDPVLLESAAGPIVTIAGREVLCFCSNDYLGLAADEAVKRAAANAVARWGVGSGASRLVSGTQLPHVQLERKIAEFKHADDAVLTSTGWMANRAAITALVGVGDVIFSDKLNHASILDASGGTPARLRSYHHCDVDRLAKLLRKHRSEYRRCLIITDSLFSMDGDIAPLADLVELKNRYDARLLIDDAHATGVLGENGRGAAELAGVEDEIDVTVGTLSKALGCLGGFIAGNADLIGVIRNTARSYIYTTAQPAAICAAASAAFDIVETQPDRRRKLLEMSQWLRGQLNSMGFDTRDSQSQIIPVVIGEADKAVRISKKLLDAGFLVPAIRPPTVAKGTSRLRISLSSEHTPEQVASLLETLCRVF